MHGHKSTEGNATAHNGGEKLWMVDDAIKEIFLTITFSGFGSLICFLGTIANTVNLTVLLKQDFADTINISLFGLAVSDGSCLLTQLWVNIGQTLKIGTTSPPVVWVELARVTGAVPYSCFSRISGLITTYITFERSLCIASPLKVKEILTPTRTTCIIVSLFLIVFAVTVLAFTVNQIRWKVLPETNRTVLGSEVTETRAEVEDIVYLLNNVFGYISFIGSIIFTTILVVFLNSKAKWRQKSTAMGLSPTATRDRKIIRMVVTISTVFIICYFPRTLVYFSIMVDPSFDIHGDYHNLVMMVISVAYCMETINCSINILIYRSMSSKYKHIFDLLFANLLRCAERKLISNQC